MGYCFHHLRWYQLCIQRCYCNWYSKGSITPVPTETVDIAVSVTDKTSTEAIGSVAVTLTDSTDSTKTYTGTTGGAGGCNITSVPLGNYDVTAEKEGYTTYESTLEVTADTSSLEIEMEEAQQQEDTPGEG